jgi:hypothetical protein
MAMFASGTPTIYNVTLTSANTQYSQALPVGCKRFAVGIIDGVSTNNFRIAYVTGKVAGPTAPYLKYPCTAEYSEADLNGYNSLTVYVAGSNAGDVAQIIAWV